MRSRLSSPCAARYVVRDSAVRAAVKRPIGGMRLAQGPVCGRTATASAMLSRLILISVISVCALLGCLLAPGAQALAAPGAPLVQNASVSTVTANSATFKVQIDPQGANTEYRVEYGKCASLAACVSSGYEESVPVPDGLVGSGFGLQAVSAHPQDLSANTAYHYRVVAHNEHGTTDGEERTLTTQPPGQPFQLPDGRAWEMVSPPQKEGAQFAHIAIGILQGAADGNAFTDFANASTEANPAGSYYGAAVFFGRGSNGWTSKVITPPHSERPTLPPVGAGQEYRIFSEDLSRSILQPFGGFRPLSVGVSESTPYVRTDYLNGNPGELCGADCYEPLVSDANVPAGTNYGGEANGPCEAVHCGPEVIGADPDLSHVVLRSSVALTSTPTNGWQSLYEWSGGQLALVSLLPVGEENEEKGPLGLRAEFGNEQGSAARHAISTDGSRVVWTGGTQRFGASHIYVRDVPSSGTTRIDVPNADAPPPEGEPAAPQYMTASADTSRIFFLDSERLTADSTAQNTSPQAPDLYEYNASAPAGEKLTDLSVDANAGEHADVSMVTGASEDGLYVYFTAVGALAPGATPGECRPTQPEAGDTRLCNLYVRHGGRTTFVAGLSSEDKPDWSNLLYQMPARVSPDGRWLAFMSNRNLTGYDTSDAVSGRPDEEVYLYDAYAGRLACASCNPTGARPAGVADPGSDLLIDGEDIFPGGSWIAANVPPWTGMDLSEVRYQSRYLSDSGRLFFDSHDALAAQDVNGTQDVYEYEPAGMGDCSAAAVAFSARSGGCASLVSSGESSSESVFLDASGTGGDVFFLTAAKLLPQDFDSGYDVYDARECGSPSRCLAPAPASPPPCDTGDSCKPGPAPPPAVFGSPASATFAGAGNVTLPAATPAVRARVLTRAQRLARALKACHRKKGKRRKACERQARARYGVGQSRKANATKRGGR
jgi:hypothetical protein